MVSHTSPRAIDHLVLPVADLEQARDRYAALGFTVAPTGFHPFGTENCCIFFRDGTFLEPLGIAQRETCEEAARRGNTFIRSDQAYRFRRGEDGCSHLVIKTDDASADDRAFRRAGFRDGNMVRFSRAFQTPSGESGRVSFKLAFAADPRSPDARFFACEVVNAPRVDRSSLIEHKNAVCSLKEVVLSEVNPTDFQYFFQTFLNQRHMNADSFGMSFETANATVSVLTADGMKAFYNRDVEKVERGLRFQVIVLGSDDIGRTRKVLEEGDVAHSHDNRRVIVPPAAGQGCTYVIEANS